MVLQGHQTNLKLPQESNPIFNVFEAFWCWTFLAPINSNLLLLLWHVTQLAGLRELYFGHTGNHYFALMKKKKQGKSYIVIESNTFMEMQW